MADGITGSLNSLSALGQSSAAGQTTKKENAGESTKNEFIHLLVTQLKNQDPLNPLENQEFAVQLAQFSQLEQLVGINEAMTKGGNGSDVGSLASYLGHRVVLNTNAVEVANRSAGEIQFELNADATDVVVRLLNSQGAVAETINLGPLSKGIQNIELKDLGVSSGTYRAEVSASVAGGASLKPSVNSSGVVNGFVPGADPVLLIGQKEISTSDIKEVRSAS